MTFFEWNPQLSVENPSIDEDHKHLIQLVNEFGVVAAQDQEIDRLEQILQTLLVYTQEHFQKEEELMAAIGYHKIKPHQEQHRKLLARVEDLHNEFHGGKRRIASETAELLRFWLTSHIMLSDKELAEAIRRANLQ